MEIFITIIAILFAHFLSDFVLQTEYMKKNKSEKISILSAHVAVYTVTFFILFVIYGWFVSTFIGSMISQQHWVEMAVGISIVNGILHYIIDYFTSILNKWLWNTNRTNLFFISIGFDQWLHTALLVFSFGQMLNNFGYF